MNHESKRPITVEDLLQLKRAERPSAEFWTGFERDLRAKQLAALVEKRPWWRTTPRIFAGFSRYHLPLGATAILALTFYSVRDYRTVTPEGALGPATPAQVASAKTAPAPVALIAADPLRDFVVAAAPVNSGDLASVTAAVEENSDAVITSRISPAVALLDPENDHGAPATPSARAIAANFAAAQAADPELARRFRGVAHGYESRALPARASAVDPLAQMTPPSEARRSRQLASAMSASYVPKSGSSSEKNAQFTSRIPDDRLYELAVSRFGAKGAGAFVKF